MVARRKLVRTDLTLEMGRLVAEIQMHDELGEKTKNGLLKDAHMLAAGLLGDRILITGDKLLKAYAVYLRRNSEIEWLMIVDGNDSLHRSLLIRLGELSKAKTPQVNKP